MELSNLGADSGGQSDRRACWETSLGERARGSARLSLAAEEGALPAGIVTAYPPEQ